MELHRQLDTYLPTFADGNEAHLYMLVRARRRHFTLFQWRNMASDYVNVIMMICNCCSDFNIWDFTEKKISKQMELITDSLSWIWVLSQLPWWSNHGTNHSNNNTAELFFALCSSPLWSSTDQVSDSHEN